MDQCKNIYEFPEFDSYPEHLQDAICEQLDIGVNLFKLGIMSSKFGEIKWKCSKMKEPNPQHGRET